MGEGESGMIAGARAQRPHPAEGVGLCAWRHWYHITLGTYGHWLPGDERGWSERHHRKHAPGGTLHPSPPTRYTFAPHEYAKRVMRREAFAFAVEELPLVGSHLLASLTIQETPVLCLAVGREHCHLLVQCVDDNPRGCAGNLKGHVYHQMFARCATPWEKRSHEEPIADEAHGRIVFRYIMAHAREGAWVWNYRESRGEA
jgi:hypothetical protein